MFELDGRNILVLGLGATGMSMTRWLHAHGATVRVADSREHPPNAARLEHELPRVEIDAGPLRADSFRSAEMIAISPGVPLTQPLVAAAAARGVPIVGDIELFAQAMPRASRVIAITGSNGKSTVTTMAGDMCKAAGLDTVVAGNIGLPVLEALTGSERSGVTPDVYVLELSSFQLETTHSLAADAATVLNLSEDHLDRYDSMQDYAAAKARIFNGGGVQVLNRDDARSLAMALPGRTCWRFGLDEPAGADDWGVLRLRDEPWLAQGPQALMPAADLAVTGMHNAANALAALALVRALDIPYRAATDALRAFQGLAHRVQQIAEIGGVVFLDDSKGTNVGATVAALNGLPRKAVLIAGGDGKGQDFAPLRGPVQAHARAVVLIGRDREQLAAAIAASGVTVLRADSLPQAVQMGYGQAQPGDAVLLSPACASYDMFDNYEQRARVFAEAVAGLAREEHK